MGAALVLLWLGTAALGYLRFGLFSFPGPGNDFGYYWMQSEALLAGNLDELYTEDGRRAQHAALSEWAGGGVPLDPTPYPPLWPWLFAPFTLPIPPLGFLLWTAVNLGAAFWLARRVAEFFPAGDRLWAAILLVTAFPVAFTVYLGQMHLFLAIAIGECYLALRAGRDLRAGLWLSLLIIKPQYAVLLGLLLIWKRRWLAVAGSALGIALILGASALVTSPRALLDWPSAFAADDDFRADAPEYMVNWRSNVLRAFPSIADSTGVAIVLALGLITVVGAALVWRGRWSPRDSRFPAQMTLLLLATLLASYHSHGYGAAILAVPLASLVAETQLGRTTKLVIASMLVLPNLALVAGLLPGRGIPLTATALALALLACFGALLWELYSDSIERAVTVAPSGSPGSLSRNVPPNVS